MDRIVSVGTSKANAMDSHTLSLMEVTLMSNLDCLGVLTIKFHRKDKITICYLHYSQNCSTQRILKLCDRSIKYQSLLPTAALLWNFNLETKTESTRGNYLSQHSRSSSKALVFHKK